jgi:hypothetical protein
VKKGAHGPESVGLLLNVVDCLKFCPRFGSLTLVIEWGSTAGTAANTARGQPLDRLGAAVQHALCKHRSWIFAVEKVFGTLL